MRVAPLAGAWIEISGHRHRKKMRMSLPSRERGLKYQLNRTLWCTLIVAPLAGAWIEIGCHSGRPVLRPGVAPLAGAWIEISVRFMYCCAITVAPLAGAWIEILMSSFITVVGMSRSPRGSVD